jgi:hypothetical protein
MMNRCLLALALALALCTSALAQGAATTRDDITSIDVSRSRDRTEEQSGSNWLTQALAAHGSARTRSCVDRISAFYGVKASGDPWALPSSADDAQWRAASACTAALNEITRRLAARLGRPGLLPDPMAPAAAALVAVPRADEDEIYYTAESSIGQIHIDSGKGRFMAWWSDSQRGQLQFEVQGGRVAMLRSGRPIFDADHIDGKRITYKVATSKSSSTSVSDKASSRVNGADRGAGKPQ